MSESRVDGSTSRFVVGVDGSDQSIAALRHARRMASALGAEVEVIIAWEWPYLADPQMIVGYAPEEDARLVAEGVVREVYGEAGHVPIFVVEGPPAKVLIDAGQGAAMIVVGSRGHGGFAGLLLGSVSAAVAEHAQCPVLVVHE